MAKPLALIHDGSKPLKVSAHERYARLRAQALPRVVAFRKAGYTARTDALIDKNAGRVEKKPGVRARIDWLIGQAQDRIVEKRQRIEEQLWSVLEADIGDFWETYEAAKTSKDGKLATDPDGKMLTVRKQRAKLINDLPLEARKLIEDVTVDRNGNVIPKLYSKAQANAELRKLHNFGRTDERPDTVSQLSDAELIAQLADLSKQLGVTLDLNYSFAARPANQADDGSQPGADLPAAGETIDHEPAEAQLPADDAAARDAARDLRIAAEPGLGARPARKAR